MKILYLDCGMGAAGDMLQGALLQLLPEREEFLESLNKALDGRAIVSAAPDKKCGIGGLHVTVTIDGDVEGQEPRHHHQHTSLKEIYAHIQAMELPEKIKSDCMSVYRLVAEAESQVHGMDMENIHFHELGSLDALADILGVCMLIDRLAPDKIIASPICTGCGSVKCAHGIVPVPAPATELILRGLPIRAGNTEGELCTPTGAALLKHFVNQFGPMPLMIPEKSGYGTGTKDFPQANMLRAILGEAQEEEERILELCCNLDDMSGEELGFAMEALFSAGALDVYFEPITMKKSRPAVKLCCICRREQRDTMLRCIFKNTASLGVREYDCARYTLRRSVRTDETKYGPVRIKQAEGWGVSREKPEYEDMARLARENDISLSKVAKELK